MRRGTGILRIFSIHELILFYSARCYSSPDLLSWTFERVILTRNEARSQLSDDLLTILERPKLVQDVSGNIVLLVHLDYKDYSYAKVGFATANVPSNNPCGSSFILRNSVRPAGLESRDIGVYSETSGVYLLFASGHVNTDFSIAKLTDDCLDVENTVVSSIHGGLEGPSLIQTSWGQYFLFLSRTTGWRAK